MVPATFCPQLAGPRLNVIVLNETIIILIFTGLRTNPLPCPGQWAMLIADAVFAAEVAFGSKCNEEREDHSSQHNPHQHRPCPGPRAWPRGHG